MDYRRILKTLLAVIIFLFPVKFSLATDWKYVGLAGLSTGEYKLYVDLEKLEKHNDLVVMHELHSFRFEQFAPEGGYKSQTQKWEYDCENMLLRALGRTLFKDNMGRSPILGKRNATNLEWIKIKPGEALESKWRVACELAKS